MRGPTIDAKTTKSSYLYPAALFQGASDLIQDMFKGQLNVFACPLWRLEG